MSTWYIYWLREHRGRWGIFFPPPHHSMPLTPVPHPPAFLEDTASTSVHCPSLLHSKQLPTDHLSAASLQSQRRKLRPYNYDILGVILTISHYSKTTHAIPIYQHKEMTLTKPELTVKHARRNKKVLMQYGPEIENKIRDNTQDSTLLCGVGAEGCSSGLVSRRTDRQKPLRSLTPEPSLQQVDKIKGCLVRV